MDQENQDLNTIQHRSRKVYEKHFDAKDPQIERIADLGEEDTNSGSNGSSDWNFEGIDNKAFEDGMVFFQFAVALYLYYKNKRFPHIARYS